MTWQKQSNFPADLPLGYAGDRSPASSNEKPTEQIPPKPPNELELRFLGVEARARGTLANIAICFLVIIWLLIQVVHKP